ncbi:MAG: gamma-glutamyl-gamma-aminobutyrate hydrolase family protein [Deltaproteobacteria bacterium]|nr:gamma-glutamyl-gamma-aminobutyrate hydrolase family protein [Deltaproteobacteria bacterium]
MDDILVFQHEPAEELGSFAHLLDEQGIGYSHIRLFGDEIPTESWDEVRALIVLGGSMGVHEEEKYPFLKWEKTIIRAAIKNGLPLLGICLGAQLIASAVGAEVYQGNFKEIGWYPISMTLEGEMDSLLGHLPDKAIVFQWHGDSFDLPKGAHRLASSLYYDNQAFRIGRSIYGLQFHLEVTPAMIDRWIDQSWKELAQIPYISPDKIRADTLVYSQTLKYYGERFFSEFIRRLSIPKRRREDGQQVKT